MTGEPESTPFSAVDPTLGYLYQVRTALLWTLRKLKHDPDFLVSVESLDDVAFETTGGDFAELLQLKHHNKGAANLTDASVDLWKTLRVWFENSSSGLIPSHAHLYLVTTAIAPDGSAASRLRSDPRDVAAAKSALDATAGSSSNQANKTAYEAYLKAAPSQRSALLERVTVIDASPRIDDLDAQMQQEVYWAAKREHHIPFLERLEGWWLRRVLKQLTGSHLDRVGSVELEAHMTDLREQFKQDALPIDEDLLQFTLDQETHTLYEGFVFVRQMELINPAKARIAAAIRDYYRAYQQRSRWLRDDLVVGLDLHIYEKRLCEEWELVFASMRDELGDGATDDAKASAARSILRWAEQATIHIRANVTEPFLCRGSLHMLADEVRIGWHPDFKESLHSILSAREGRG